MRLSPAAQGATWSLEGLVPAPGSAARAALLDGIAAEIAKLGTACGALPAPGAANVAVWWNAIEAAEGVMAKLYDLATVAHALTQADTGDEQAATELERLHRLVAAFEQARAPLLCGLAGCPQADFDALFADGSDERAALRYRLGRQREEAQGRLPPEKQAMADALDPVGRMAWSRLYERILSTLRIERSSGDGAAGACSYAEAEHALGTMAEAEARRDLFLGIRAALANQAPALVASLNGVLGGDLVLLRERGVADSVAHLMRRHGVEPRTVDTMMRVLHEARGVLTGFLRAKARLLGRDRPGIQDLTAVLPGAAPDRLSWAEACERVPEALGTAAPGLGDCARRMLECGWIDGLPRPGKGFQGFCSPLYGADAALILLNFDGSLRGAMILAHEVGHAYHAHVLRRAGGRPLLMDVDLPLAETASNVAEQIVRDTLLARAASPQTRLAIRGLQLNKLVRYLLLGAVAHEFELRMIESRMRGPLPHARITELMRELQDRWFGDAFDGERYDDYQWAKLPQLFRPDVRLYGFPYPFGYFISDRLMQGFRDAGARFAPTYDAFLALTASHSAEDAVRKALDEDLSDAGFWERGMERVQALCNAFLADAGAASAPGGR